MTFQTILAVGAWVLSVIAISVAGSAKEKVKNNSYWLDTASKRIHERINDIARDNRDLQGQHCALSKRVDDLENQLAEEEDCEPCRPRTYVVDYGYESDVLWKVKCDLLTQIAADQIKEILLLRKENKELKKKQCRKYEKGE